METYIYKLGGKTSFQHKIHKTALYVKQIASCSCLGE